ncbi:TonB-dependent receptor [Prevotella multiformis]|uniref:TonB-dependent receptor plug domain protein n=1 Tax=Prevotella multiformis DSM 16608 TaxID=888743 RepID=F0F8I9_9BACT|nr:TonB-dependent receptor [Prevotella multiformis]EGC19366.1 TonB-dependent receptor plug domain protein [Prevotella multiformis DSM 16608]
MQKRLLFLVTLLLAMTTTVMAQITTSGISGKVTSQGEDVIGATVTATHVPSGTVYRAVTNIDGRYTIQGMRVGGPYKVSVAYVGQKTKTFENVTLRLGETEELSCSLQDDSKELQEVVVTGSAGVNATKTGAATSLSSKQIADMPSITHGIADVARLNPQLTTSNNGAMSFAGTSNRYNSFMIDGAANNDVFGLAADGANGGQAGAQPVSMETIEQIQVNVAPFDVRQGGFTGGAINAITKSGTNVFHGSVYGFGNNQNLIGSKYPLADGGYAPKYNKQQEYNAGITFGGPIIKDKLFFFANYEKTNKTYPNLYTLGAESSAVDAAKASDVLAKIADLAQRQGVNYPTALSTEDIYTRSDKGGLKLDWNINETNKATLRWSIVSASQLNNAGSRKALNGSSYAYPFKSVTNSFIAELQSRLSPSVANEARASYVRVRDKRDINGEYPSISVNNVGGGSVNLGIERSSMANRLDQDIYTLEDNLTWYKGNHTYTFGTHNELYKFTNLFLQDLFGSYTFKNYDAFKSYYDDYVAGTIDPAKSYLNQYRYGHANTDVTGDPRWEASFGAAQLSFYAQDKWDVSNNFQLTYGLRMDMPVIFDTPTANEPFNQYAETRGWNVKTNQKLSSTPLWSPRVGFRWDINHDHRFILRGGAGVFTGRIPFVWISNNYSNTGIQLSTYNSYKTNGLDLLLDPNAQEANASKLKATGSQTINVYDRHFKFAQNLRFNLGFDFNVLGINWTAEAIYSKTLNDILYQNLAYEQTGKTYGQVYGSAGAPVEDNRPLFAKTTNGTPFANIYKLSNTSKGYTVNLSLKAEKHFNFGLDLMASYTWARSMSVNNGGSSVAESNWRFNYTYRNSNDPELGRSAYNVPHRLQASVYYHANYGSKKEWQTTVGLIYQGRSGSPYTLYYYGDVNEDGANGNDLFFIPTDAQIDKMRFDETDFSANALTKAVFGEGFTAPKLTEDMQRQLMKYWIGNDSYMKKHRGEFYKRYADNLAFEHHFDVHLAQKYSFKVGGQMNSLELSFDIINVGNLLNKDWGHTHGDGFGVYYSPVNYQKNGHYQFTGGYATRDYSDYYSRWRGQVGLRYTF